MTSGGSKKSGQSVPGEDSGSQVNTNDRIVYTCRVTNKAKAKTHDQCCGTSADVLETDHLVCICQAFKCI